MHGLAEIINNPVAHFIGSLLLFCGVVYLNGKLAPIKKDIDAIKEDIDEMKPIFQAFHELKGSHDAIMQGGGHHGKRK